MAEDNAGTNTVDSSAVADAGSAGVQSAAAPAAPQPEATTPDSGTAQQTADEQMQQIYDGLVSKAGANGSARATDAPASSTRQQQASATDGDGGTDAPAGTPGKSGARSGGSGGGASGGKVLAAAKDLLGTVNAYKGKVKDMPAEAVLDAARQQARQALKLWQWPDEMIAAAPDELLLERGLVARQTQVAQDLASNERARFRQMYEDMQREQPAPGTAGVGSAATQATATTSGQPPAQLPAAGAGTLPGAGAAAAIDQSVEAALAGIEEDGYHADLRPILSKALGAVSAQAKQQVEQVARQVREELTAQFKTDFENGLADAYLKLDRVLFDTTANTLATQIPALGDPAKRSEVFKKVRELGNLRGYRDDNGELQWEKVVTDAYRLQFGPEEKRQHETNLVRRYGEQTRGQPKGSDAPAPQSRRPQTPDEQMQAAVDLLRSGRSPDEARAELAATG